MFVELEESLSHLPLPKFWMITRCLNWFGSDQVLTASIILSYGQERPLSCDPHFREPHRSQNTFINTRAPLGWGPASQHWHGLVLTLNIHSHADGMFRHPVSFKQKVTMATCCGDLWVVLLKTPEVKSIWECEEEGLRACNAREEKRHPRIQPGLSLKTHKYKQLPQWFWVSIFLILLEPNSWFWRYSWIKVIFPQHGRGGTSENMEQYL